MNSILPGRIATDRIVQMSGSREAAEEAARSQVPAGRLGTVDDMMGILVFLASDESLFATGNVYPVDGGMTI